MAVMRTLILLCLGAAVLATAGCGGTVQDAATPRSAEAAAVVPADAAAYVGIVTDDDSEQWRNLETLLAKFPDGDRLVATIAGELAGRGIDWERDVRPALGPVTAVVSLTGSGEPVAVTKPSLRAKLDALLGRTGTSTVTQQLDDGWVAVAEERSTLDAFVAAAKRGHLAEEADFREAVDELPIDALATLYLSPAALNLGGWAPAGALVPSAQPLAAAGQLQSVAFALVAEDDALRFEGTVRGEDAEALTYDPALLDDVPADAVAAISFHGTDDLVERLQGAGGLGPFLPAVEESLGVKLEELSRLVEGEGVLYVRPGLPIPEVTLAVEADDPAGAMATLDRLARHLGATVESVDAGGVEAHTVRIDSVRITWSAADGTLLVSTAPGALADFRSDGPKLVDDESFEAAAREIGFEGRTAGLVYADLPRVVRLVEGLADLAGEELPDEARRNLAPLQTFAASARNDGDVLRFQGLLAVDGS
jgi:hypothetical protein